jgi:hypothetical protein
MQMFAAFPVNLPGGLTAASLGADDQQAAKCESCGRECCPVCEVQRIKVAWRQ